MSARARAWARWLLPLPGGPDSRCSVSARRHGPLSLAPPRRADADRPARAPLPRRRARPGLPLAGRHVVRTAGVDDLEGEHCAHVALVDQPQISVQALEALHAFLCTLPGRRPVARLSSAAPQGGKEAREDAEAEEHAARVGLDCPHAVGGRAGGAARAGAGALRALLRQAASAVSSDAEGDGADELRTRSSQSISRAPPSSTSANRRWTRSGTITRADVARTISPDTPGPWAGARSSSSTTTLEGREQCWAPRLSAAGRTATAGRGPMLAPAVP